MHAAGMQVTVLMWGIKHLGDRVRQAQHIIQQVDATHNTIRSTTLVF